MVFIARPGAAQIDKKPLLTINDNVDGTTSIAFAPDGKFLAVANGMDGKIRFWEFDSGTWHQLVLTHTSPPDANHMKIAFSRDNTFLASVRRSAKGQMRIWDWRNGRELAHLDDLVVASNLAFSPSGRMIAVVDAPNITVFDVREKKTIHKLRHKDGGNVSWLAFSPDGKKLAVSGACFRRLRIWNVIKGVEEKVLLADTEKGCFTDVYWNKGGESLIVFGLDNTISYWDVALGLIHKRFDAIPGPGPAPVPLLSFAMSPDEKYLALGTAENQLHLWEAATGKYSVLKNYSLPSFSADGTLFAAVVTDQRSAAIRIWSFADLCAALK
ncbi:MAG: WD40 repeat domain-containing protein [Planctomycetes bacterium]|nr:WD40 repeat domain-containing protein [Planctomycetota bacterium]